MLSYGALYGYDDYRTLIGIHMLKVEPICVLYYAIWAAMCDMPLSNCHWRGLTVSL